MNATAPYQTDSATPNTSPSGLLRFITAGSVDDGKSTLIGRLLYDTGNVAADQLAAVAASSQKRGMAHIDLSLLTDGLMAEREQGITIDVAYRYFATPHRKFIIGDAPGHEQYTRNMVTAASNADVAVLLVDARKGIVTQTRRHAYLAHLMGIKTWVLAINKMDLLDWQEQAYQAIVDDFMQFSEPLGAHQVQAIPMSALTGDNVVTCSSAMPWYDGPTLLDYLEQVPAWRDASLAALRLPIQRTVRVMLGNGAGSSDGKEQDFRGYQGMLASGTLQVGDTVAVFPSGGTAKITSLKIADRSLSAASADRSVVVSLDRELDISRGDLLAAPHEPPSVCRQIEADICWLSAEPLLPACKYLLKHTTRTVNARLLSIQHKVDVNTLRLETHPDRVGMNDIVRVSISLQQPLIVDSYTDNRVTGSFIIIDPVSLNTVAAGVIV